MRLIGNHHDVGSFAQHWKAVFIRAWHKLLNGGKHNATGGAIGQLAAQISTGFHLHRLLADQILRQGKHPEMCIRDSGSVCDRQGGSIQTGPFGSQLHASDYVEDVYKRQVHGWASIDTMCCSVTVNTS